MTISTTAFTPVGTYTIRVTGIGPSQTHSVRVTVVVTGDFIISSGSPALSVGAGSKTTTTMTVHSLGFSNRTVTLTASVSNATINNHLTASLNPVSLALTAGGSFSSLLNLNTTSLTPVGTYDVTFNYHSPQKWNSNIDLQVHYFFCHRHRHIHGKDDPNCWRAITLADPNRSCCRLLYNDNPCCLDSQRGRIYQFRHHSEKHGRLYRYGNTRPSRLPIQGPNSFLRFHEFDASRRWFHQFDMYR